MRILLINPDAPDDTNHALTREISYLASRQSGGVVAPLSLVTIAALTPPEHEVWIHDEIVRGPVEDLLRRESFDVIGISALNIHIGRAFRIGTFCKEGRLPSTLVLGGPGTSFMVKRMSEVIDVFFLGEAEETWPRFLEEHQQGRAQALYQQVSKPDMARSPVPRWDLIREDLGLYAAGAVQTTRGCPFDCAFCDVIYIYGRKARSKPVAQVLEEIRIQQSMGVKYIFVADDDFAGNKKRSKELLRELVKLNNSFPVPLQFLTQIDITLASDEEMLELMADSGFVNALVGVESPNAASLKELQKHQNLRQDIGESLRKIQSYGISVMGSMIVGADADDLSAFQDTERLVREANVTDHYLYPLIAPFGTRIWYQMRREGRILDVPIEDLGTIITNVVPKRMSRPDWFEHLADYYERVMQPGHYLERAIGFVDGVKRRPRVKRPPLRYVLSQTRLLAKMLRYYTTEVGADHRRAFFTLVRHTLRTRPWLLSTVLLVHTRFVLLHKRAMLGARRLRARAAYERAHPEAAAGAAATLPIPPGVRENAKEIFGVAYAQIHAQVSHRETLYRVIVEAMVDYVDRFGESFAGLDDHHRVYIHESCDRILAQVHAPMHVSDEDRLPARPPAGFTREILDALDHALRSRELLGA